MMDCNVIRDLMLLCADDCCSDESRRLVEEHIQSCEECRKAYEEMRTEPLTEINPYERPAPPRLRRVNDWKASVLQSALLFVSFALLVLGVAREAATPAGNANGLWAIGVIVPVMGFLLSLANWYFVRLYPNRRAFSVCSLLATLGFIVCGYVWAAIHYRADWTTMPAVTFLILGGVLSVLFCVLSYLLSRKYAEMLGKE